MRYLKTAAQISLTLALVCPPVFAQQPLDITWANEALTARVADAPLAEVVLKVAQLAGIEVVGQEKLSGKVSVEFANLAPRPALDKILTNVNYVIQESPAAETKAPRHLVLRVHSMSGDPLPPSAFDGPIQVPALEALTNEELADVQDGKEVEAEDEDSVDDIRDEKLDASRLASEGAFGPTADVQSLLKLVENYYNDEIRLEALKALGTRPMKVALRPVAHALGDEAWEVRMTAIEILGRAKDPESLRAVGQLLEKNPDRDVRIGALRVLALRGDPESAVYLRTVLRDEDGVIRTAAEQILAEFDRRAQAKQRPSR